MFYTSECFTPVSVLHENDRILKIFFQGQSSAPFWSSEVCCVYNRNHDTQLMMFERTKMSGVQKKSEENRWTERKRDRPCCDFKLDTLT